MLPPLRTFLKDRGPGGASIRRPWPGVRHAPPDLSGKRALPGLRVPKPHTSEPGDSTTRPSWAAGNETAAPRGSCAKGFFANTALVTAGPPSVRRPAGGEREGPVLRWTGVWGLHYKGSASIGKSPRAGLRCPRPTACPRPSLAASPALGQQAWRREPRRPGLEREGVKGAGRGVQPARLRPAPGWRGLWNLPSHARGSV